MAGSTIDHLIAMTIFLGALLILISLFNQTIQTAVLYQRNRAIATKCSDLLDNIILNPGSPLQYEEDTPIEWGKLDCTPVIFGLQDPEFSQYRLSPFSLMRLLSSSNIVTYSRTGISYSKTSVSWGSFLYISCDKVLNYQTVATLLGLNGSYGFQLTFQPIINVSVSKIPSSDLTLKVSAKGAAMPLTNAKVTYMLIKIEEAPNGYPTFAIFNGTVQTDGYGEASLTFSGVNGESDAYALVAYVNFNGLVGVGYYNHATVPLDEYVVPLVDNFEKRRVTLTHSWIINGEEIEATSELRYTATFLILTEDFNLRMLSLEENSFGSVRYSNGVEEAYGVINIPTYNPGILAVAFSNNRGGYGFVMMPWGVSTMAFPVVFGDNPSGRTLSLIHI